MMKPTFTLLAAVAMSALAGCQLYFGEEHEDESWTYCGSDGYYECNDEDCYWRGPECPSGTGGGSGVSPPTGPFTCTQYIGAYLSMEWWNQGFQQQPGIEDAKWQLKWHHHGTIGNWADPNSPFWSDEGDPQDDSKGAPIQSACTTNSKTPDRIVMLTNGPAATIGSICEVPLVRPRQRLELITDPTYIACRAAVLEFLHKRHRFVDAA